MDAFGWQAQVQAPFCSHSSRALAAGGRLGLRLFSQVPPTNSLARDTLCQPRTAQHLGPVAWR